MSHRLGIDEYLMTIAIAASARSTCPRMACGAVVSESGVVVATGYNGAPSGMAHCTDVGCDMQVVRDRERCTRIQHAESNALFRAAGRGNWLHCTGQPCYECLKDILTNNNIKRVVWLHAYPDPQRDLLLDQLWEDHRGPHIYRLEADLTVVERSIKELTDANL